MDGTKELTKVYRTFSLLIQILVACYSLFGNGVCGYPKNDRAVIVLSCTAR